MAGFVSIYPINNGWKIFNKTNIVLSIYPHFLVLSPQTVLHHYLYSIYIALTLMSM